MRQDNQLAAWTARADRLSPYAPRRAIRDLINTAPPGANNLLAWWRGVEDGRTAVSVEYSRDDALAGLRYIPAAEVQRRAGFLAGVMVQSDLDEIALDVTADALAAAEVAR